MKTTKTDEAVLQATIIEKNDAAAPAKPSTALAVAAAEAAPAIHDDPNTHTLDTPLENGDNVITRVTLHKPNSGALRGTSLSALVNLDVDSLRKVLPRVSTPTLTEWQVTMMDPADLVALGGIFIGFLMPKAVKANMESLTA
ncbi:phage tail assembly protein [Burkholderia sp. Bp9140]|uniref:phage tail assembly protein n=1 Tax=Burkholderia sp. Bp9140 TaxID=2184572 RepID=UPI000F573658|nr:phage tail assembly protein [Burkholderia sp. Bp9140]RQR50454.1 phage tail assembly protein [Burkholderia sp. Bp9140]